MCLHEEKASFRYPWNIHMYLIFPLAAITLFTAFAFGWQGEGPYHVFTEFRAAYPFLSRVFHSITDWGNPLLYCIYVMLLIRAIRTGDIKIIWNIVCVLILSLLFLGIFLQLLKYGLGMPRPGIPWPPRPWSSAAYTSFPSGIRRIFLFRSSLWESGFGISGSGHSFPCSQLVWGYPGSGWEFIIPLILQGALFSGVSLPGVLCVLHPPVLGEYI